MTTIFLINIIVRIIGENMFIELSTKELKKTLYNLLLTTSKDRNSIFSSTLIEVNGDKVFLSSTNLITKLKTVIKISKADTQQLILCLNTEKLYNIVKQITEDHIKLNISDKTINIASSHFKAQLKREDETLYPKPTKEEKKSVAIIKSETIKKLISSTIFSSGKNSVNQEYNGIFFKLTENNITTTATNGYRLEETKKTELDSEEELNETQFLIDIDGAILLQHLLENGKTIISTSDKNIYFEYNNKEIQIRLIQAVFPDYKAIIPEIKEDIVVKSKELRDAINSVLIINPKGFINISSNNKSQLQLTSNNEEGETINYILDEVKISDTIQFTINGKYVTDFLKLVQSEYITITFNDENSPILLSTIDEPYHYKYIVVSIND
jgi:DNA polymerase III beta subunit